MNAQIPLEFRWSSPLGISAALLLGYGALNTLVGVVIPFLSRRTGTAGFATQPTLDLITILWLGFGLFQISLVWFGVRAGYPWAFWTVALADLAQPIGWIAYGVQTRDWSAPLFLYDAIFLLPAIILGWIGLR